MKAKWSRASELVIDAARLRADLTGIADCRAPRRVHPRAATGDGIAGSGLGVGRLA